MRKQWGHIEWGSGGNFYWGLGLKGSPEERDLLHFGSKFAIWDQKTVEFLKFLDPVL
jgi:hypothetical protein